MPKKAKPLSALAVAKMKGKGFTFVGGIDGLAISVAPTGAKSWILRVMVAGKRRDIGLGPFPEVTLAQARDAAAALRQKIREGIDPLEAKREAKAGMLAARASFISFEDAATQYIATHEAGWKNLKHAAQWRATLETYAYPLLGKLHVKDMSLEHILKVIEPIWATKTETASRLRGRIEAVLDWARVRGYRTGDNPARWKGNLDTLLPARKNVATVAHHEALPWHDTPAFMQELRKEDCSSARALELCILTAARSGEVRLATWDEIDFERAVWTIPAARMKAGKEHRIPLTPAALELLRRLPRMAGCNLIFPNSRGKPQSDVTMTALLRRKGTTFTVHGFRSTFRDWAGETTAFPREVIEHALAHQLKDKAEAAYARGDLFTKRTRLMEAWAAFLENGATGNKVIPINKGDVSHG